MKINYSSIVHRITLFSKNNIELMNNFIEYVNSLIDFLLNQKN